MIMRHAALAAILFLTTTAAASAQANGAASSMSNGSAAADTKQKADESGANAMAKGRSGNSGPASRQMGGSNAMSGSGRKAGH